MTAQVAVVLNQARQALCIPVSALGDKQQDGTTTVRVLAGEQPQTRSIRTGISNNVQIQVLDGLREGEKVIIGDSSSLPKTDQSTMPPPGRR
jgi:macrolide-specific efflux system membrane fusion protein